MGVYRTSLFSQKTLKYTLLAAITIAVILSSALLIVSSPTKVDLLTIGVVSVALLNFVFYKQSPSIFLGFLAVLLTGYMFFGRGFAHLGVSPLYVGELVLFVGFLAMVSRTGYLVPLRSGPVWIYIAFAALGLAGTLAYVGTYGLDALRDAALWYYGIFMLLTAWLFRSRERLEFGVRWFSKVMPVLLLWIPTAYVIENGFRGVIPKVPGEDVAILDFKAGDMGIFLGASFVFLLLFRDKWSASIQSRWPTLLLWTLCIADFIFIATASRGAMLAIVAGVILTFVIRPSSHIWQAVLATLVVLIVFSTFAVNIDLSNTHREISLSQIQSNLSSVTGGEEEDENLQGSANWRREFWSDIIEDVVSGPYFWAGHGFGINLADHYGYQVYDASQLRSPHNISMTILARMGVPGLVLWALFNLFYVFSLLRAYFSAHRRGNRFWESLNLWLLAYWIIVILNSSFDVYLEGPQGGIWFWAVTGIGIAALQVQRREVRVNTTGRIRSDRAAVAP